MSSQFVVLTNDMIINSIRFVEKPHCHFDRSPDLLGRSGEIYSKTDLSRSGSTYRPILPAPVLNGKILSQFQFKHTPAPFSFIFGQKRLQI
jgi:hypothetical protein